MKLFVIRRRNAWKNAQELEATAAVSARVGNEEMADKVRWIRSYVVHEDDGSLGTVCIYQAINERAIREHADGSACPPTRSRPLNARSSCATIPSRSATRPSPNREGHLACRVPRQFVPSQPKSGFLLMTVAGKSAATEPTPLPQFPRRLSDKVV